MNKNIIGGIAAVVILVVVYLLVSPLLTAGPEGVAKSFLDAVSNEDLTTARGFMIEAASETDDQNLRDVIAKGSSFSIDKVDEFTTTANVQFSSTGTGDTSSSQLMLMKDPISDAWRVVGAGGSTFSGEARVQKDLRPTEHPSEDVARDFMGAIGQEMDVDKALTYLTSSAQGNGRSLIEAWTKDFQRRKDGGRVFYPAVTMSRESEDGAGRIVTGGFRPMGQPSSNDSMARNNAMLSGTDPSRGGGRGGRGGGRGGRGGGRRGGGGGRRGGGGPRGDGGASENSEPSGGVSTGQIDTADRGDVELHLQLENDQWRVHATLSIPPQELGSGRRLDVAQVKEGTVLRDYENATAPQMASTAEESN
jgi:hypothetical protein